MAGVGIGAAVLGAAAVFIPFKLMGKEEEKVEEETASPQPEAEVEQPQDESQSVGNEITHDPTDLTIAGGVNNTMSFSEAFATARAEVGAGGMFYWHGQAYGTYYAPEWNNMSASERAEYWQSVNQTVSHHHVEHNNVVNHYGGDDEQNITFHTHHSEGHLMEVAEGVSDDMSFSEAFATARAEVGPGGMFYWHGHGYGTYYETEWNAMSADERDDYWASVDMTHRDYVAHHEDPITAPYDENTGITGIYPTETINPDDLSDMNETPQLRTHYTDDDIVAALDVDDDGVSDVYVVNANDNDMPDIIVDGDGDGSGDVLFVDPVLDESGDIIDAEEIREGDFILPNDSMENNQELNTEDPLANSEDYDYGDDGLVDPDLPLYNDMDMSDML